MITEQDLQAAIAECEGTKNPNANTCIKLAAFYIIKEHMYGQPETYSYAAEPINRGSVEKSGIGIKYESDTEFGQLVSGMNEDDLMMLVDELMSTLQVVQPRLYEGVMRKLHTM